MNSIGDFDEILPHEITSAAIRNGNEWVIPLPQVLSAIRLATERLIAVLGVELFHIQADGLQVIGYSGYEFKLGSDWASFVQQNNDAAMLFVEEHQMGPGHGFILTAASEKEFAQLTEQISKWQRES